MDPSHDDRGGFGPPTHVVNMSSGAARLAWWRPRSARSAVQVHVGMQPRRSTASRRHAPYGEVGKRASTGR